MSSSRKRPLSRCGRKKTGDTYTRSLRLELVENSRVWRVPTTVLERACGRVVPA